MRVSNCTRVQPYILNSIKTEYESYTVYSVAASHLQKGGMKDAYTDTKI